jgi:hypothetical protein
VKPALGAGITGTRKLLVLDFDCECRPLAWYGGDFVTKQITAIAWKFTHELRDVEPFVAFIGASCDTRQTIAEEEQMLLGFVDAYIRADVVTGHFIRGFDLPLVNGSLVRRGLPQLPPKLAQDTKGDMARAQGLSKSQENLGAMFELDHPKVPMNTAKWELANMLVPEGIQETITRVVGDVNQHIEMRQRMLDLGILAAPSVWSPAAGHGSTKYQA